MAAKDGTGSNIHGCDPEQLIVGQFLSRVSYVKVKDISDASIIVENESGFSWKIAKPIVEKEMVSAHQIDEEQSMTRTEVVKRLQSAGDTIFSVCFCKKITEKPIAERLATIDPGDIDTPKKRRALAKEFLSGETRILVGYLYKSEPEMGRSVVIDLEIEDKNLDTKKRLVDHRTIEWLVLNKTKYVVR